MIKRAKAVGFLIVSTTAIIMIACKEDQGVHKGPFEKACAAQNGLIVRTSSNEYECQLPDGSVIKSQDKK